MKLTRKDSPFHHSLILLVLSLLIYPSTCKINMQDLLMEWAQKAFEDFVPRSKLEMCLFRRVDDQVDGEYVSFICKESLDNSDLGQAWGIVNGNTTGFNPQNLFLACETCICTEHRRTSHMVNTVQLDNTENHGKIINYTEVSEKACKMPKYIGTDLLRPFRNIKMLTLKSADIQRLELAQNNGSPILPNLEILNIIDMFNLNNKELFGPFGICQQLPSLVFMYISNSLPDSCPKTLFVPENKNSSIQVNCESLNILSINGNNLHEVENNTFDFAVNLKGLDLTNNQIHVIHDKAFQGLKDVDHILLSDNSIEIIPELLFESLLNLEVIYLNQNKLHSFNTSTLQQLTSLRILDISQNEITHIEGSFPPLEFLNMSYNQLHQIEYSTFINCSGLKQLLMSNNKIISIDHGSFEFISSLETLDLAYNQLQDGDSLHFNIQNLVYLKTLNISHNNYTALVPNMFQIVPTVNVYVNNRYMTTSSKLNSLDLSFNFINTISPGAFNSLGSLVKLWINNNPLNQVPKSVLLQLSALGYLYLANTNLTEFPLDEAGELLTVLDLTRNKLNRIPQSNRTNIVSVLILNHNCITKLSENDLWYYQSLLQLEMRWNYLSQIHPNAFIYCRLSSLDLSHNDLDDHSFNESTVTLPIHLQYINLAHNRLQFGVSMTTAQQFGPITLDISYNPIETLKYYSYLIPQGTIIMQSCNLSFETLDENNPWNFNTLDLRYNQFEEFRPIPVLKENEDYQVDLRGNELKCSCNMRWLKDAEYRRHYQVLYCEDVLTHNIVPFYDMPDEGFLCKSAIGPNCPMDEHTCVCFTNDDSPPITILVDCSNRSLEKIPLSFPTTAKTLRLEGNNFYRLGVQSFDFPTNNGAMQTEVLHLENSQIMSMEKKTFIRMLYLKKLHLEYNLIQYVNKGTFSHLSHLTVLFLNANKIVQIGEGTFDPIGNLEVLSLSDNMLQHLNQSTLNEISSLQYVSQVFLGNNPWTCECDNLTFKGWLQDHDHVVTDLTSITCNDTAIVNIPDDDLLCYDDLPVVNIRVTNLTTIAVISTIAAIAICLLIVGIITYQKRFLCKVVLYNRFKFRLNVKENPDCQYDAFVIYDNNTYEVRYWIKTILLRKLEPEFGLCIPDRNILPGIYWADAIFDAIQTSRRTILVLSESGMEDESILYAFKTAYNHSKRVDHTHRIFCILLPDANKKALIDSELTDPHVKAMLKAGQGFHVEDKMFWEKVVFCMPKPRGNSNNIPLSYMS